MEKTRNSIIDLFKNLGLAISKLVNGGEVDDVELTGELAKDPMEALKEYEAFVKDNVGNIGSCKIAISTLVSVPNTKLIINRNLYIVGMLLIISGLGITTYMIIKKKKNV